MPDQQLRATYYDTADLRMARHGVTLRYRTGEAETPRWTLKLPVGARGSELEREELNFEASRREPPAELRSLLTAYTRGEPLTAVATLRTRRRRIHLVADETPIAEVADDEVSVIEGRRVVSRFRELEVEALVDGVDLQPLGDQLRTAGATESEPIPKVVRALGSRATAPSEIAPKTVARRWAPRRRRRRQHRRCPDADRPPRSAGTPRPAGGRPPDPCRDAPPAKRPPNPRRRGRSAVARGDRASPARGRRCGRRRARRRRHVSADAGRARRHDHLRSHRCSRPSSDSAPLPASA